jgi:hypothetical protein
LAFLKRSRVESVLALDAQQENCTRLKNSIHARFWQAAFIAFLLYRGCTALSETESLSASAAAAWLRGADPATHRKSLPRMFKEFQYRERVAMTSAVFLGRCSAADA